jgi:hypothetical protein
MRFSESHDGIVELVPDLAPEIDLLLLLQARLLHELVLFPGEFRKRARILICLRDHPRSCRRWRLPLLFTELELRFRNRLAQALYLVHHIAKALHLSRSKRFPGRHKGGVSTLHVVI